MMDPSENYLAILIIVSGFGLLFVLMWLLVLWARRRSTGALMAGAFLSVFAPDPTLEQSIKLTHEAQEDQEEDDPGGAAK